MICKEISVEKKSYQIIIIIIVIIFIVIILIIIMIKPSFCFCAAASAAMGTVNLGVEIPKKKMTIYITENPPFNHVTQQHTLSLSCTGFHHH